MTAKLRLEEITVKSYANNIKTYTWMTKLCSVFPFDKFSNNEARSIYHSQSPLLTKFHGNRSNRFRDSDIKVKSKVITVSYI